MGSTNSMSRENKKKQLKRQIVPSGSPFQEEEDSREIVHKAHQRVVRKRLIILAVLVGLAAIAALVLFRYERYHTFTDYQTVWERDLVAEAQEAAAQGEGSFCGYRIFIGRSPNMYQGWSYLSGRQGQGAMGAEL